MFSPGVSGHFCHLRDPFRVAERDIIKILLAMATTNNLRTALSDSCERRGDGLSVACVQSIIEHLDGIKPLIPNNTLLATTAKHGWLMELRLGRFECRPYTGLANLTKER